MTFPTDGVTTKAIRLSHGDFLALKPCYKVGSSVENRLWSAGSLHKSYTALEALAKGVPFANIVWVIDRFCMGKFIKNADRKDAIRSVSLFVAQQLHRSKHCLPREVTGDDLDTVIEAYIFGRIFPKPLSARLELMQVLWLFNPYDRRRSAVSINTVFSYMARALGSNLYTRALMRDGLEDRFVRWISRGAVLSYEPWLMLYTQNRSVPH